MLCLVEQWQIPARYKTIDAPDGHICYDIIQRGNDEIFVVRDLPNTTYASTDSNLRFFGLKTYIGQSVKCKDTFIGALCTVYQKDFIPSEVDSTMHTQAIALL